MKLQLFLILLMIAGLSTNVRAQVPKQFAFQGVARNSNGQAVANKAISVRFTIHQGAETGGQVFQETHNPTTNASGVFNVAIGSKSTSILQNMFQSINWSNAVAYYLQVEIDPAGGSAFVTVSTTQLLSVPYAFAAARLVASGSTVLSVTGSTMGEGTSAMGNNALAIGSGTTAAGDQSFAGGIGSRATNDGAVAIGRGNKATGINTIALGRFVEVPGNFSTAIGNYTNVAGGSAIAIGNNVEANADYSFVIGNGAAARHTGAFIIADFRPNMALLPSSSAADNEMTMRFGGGYRLFTSPTGDGSTAGVTLGANGNSWASISDSTKKENYQATNGAALLSKIKGMKLGSWNYKGQDKQQYRHYGPMAQEFHSLFGHDGVGTIGNDTTIASADIDGVMMIALQTLTKQAEALENRVRQVEQLAAANKKLQRRLQQLEATRKQK
ncbi:tail fiber domain-containing protein [Niabella sp. CC-SYL272]|uniref:tail fiber domain-containing protein n=1 Tax=Niabella agricola TaxID=2891571 RepID=UPI001F377E0B|nr:tail fiber domain-containing protein [Niabella agricola]MCF3109749.1 tail fiber domain-containing protein [Niabella agricola]